MKPIIGICTNYSSKDDHGLITKLGLPGQEWQLVADDYVKAVERAGGVPVILPITRDINNILPILDILDGILFTGGSDIDPLKYGDMPQHNLGSICPERDVQELTLAQKALYEMEIPILGICRGHQLINVASGGTLYYDLNTQLPDVMCHTSFHAPKYHTAHDAQIIAGTKMHEIFSREVIGVNSYHHQSIDVLGKDFIVSMAAKDGIIEAMEKPGDRFVVSVQWHPEMMIDRNPNYIQLFKAFIESCSKA